MNDKHGYWKDKYEMARMANFLTRAREIEYINEINWCCENTIFYSSDSYNILNLNDGIGCIPAITLYPMTSTDAIVKLGFERGHDSCVLNFASFKHPGGMYLQGSTAQEESLCQKSILYNVLSRFDETYYKENRRNTNRSLYYNRALYSPGIPFRFQLANGELVVHSDILTCAAPNLKSARRYYNVSTSENSVVLEDRIRFVLNILSLNSNKFDVLILGAFGCGVFDQNPNEVARLFMENIKRFKWDNKLKEIAFAIPNGNGPISSYNFSAFKNVMKNL